jgi:hypothetical protein
LITWVRLRISSSWILWLCVRIRCIASTYREHVDKRLSRFPTAHLEMVAFAVAQFEEVNTPNNYLHWLVDCSWRRDWCNYSMTTEDLMDKAFARPVLLNERRYWGGWVATSD